MASVSIKNVEKYYRTSREDVLAVKALDLEIIDGELLVLLGPSGCGKSTTMRMIAGLEKISSGDIFIGERRVNDLTPSERNIAMAFESYALYTHLTAAQNLAFCLRARKMAAKEIKARVQKVAQMLHLESVLDKRPSELSGGHQQRLSLGRALIRNPDVFLLDEPLSHLDAKLRVQIRAEIRWLHSELKTTLVHVTHDQMEALALADRIAIMSFGELQQVGTPDGVYDQPDNLFVATFLGEPSMNIIPGSVESHNGGMRVNCSESGLSLELDDAISSLLSKEAKTSEMSVGIRPQDIALVRESEPAGDGVGAEDGAAVIPVTGEIQMIEFLGEKYAMTTRIGATEVVSTHDSVGQLQEGDTAQLRFNRSRLHFFDTQSGRAIRRN
jgi:multiple sugar transport system ATP-binding protein